MLAKYGWKGYDLQSQYWFRNSHYELFGFSLSFFEEKQAYIGQYMKQFLLIMLQDVT